MYKCAVCEQPMVYGHAGESINHWHCKTYDHTQFEADVLVRRCIVNDVSLEVFVADYPEQQRLAVRRVLTGTLDGGEK